MFGKEKYSVVLLSVITTKSFPEKNNSSGPYLAGHNEKVTQIIFLFGRLVHQSVSIADSKYYKKFCIADMLQPRARC